LAGLQLREEMDAFVAAQSVAAGRIRNTRILDSLRAIAFAAVAQASGDFSPELSPKQMIFNFRAFGSADRKNRWLRDTPLANACAEENRARHRKNELLDSPHLFRGDAPRDPRFA